MNILSYENYDVLREKSIVAPKMDYLQTVLCCLQIIFIY